ncbi:helix-turn-helix transcriptional regulator [Pseudomonas sp.]|uniref:helix-turn-helix domain-containing protein n=1 Tax=Pseudomonas sp. TaxID=306 RepID=UPI002908A21A|nr:helix-turn-helix transcriptional regulator [Pseudomonas sp.]MDU4254913.1 helix-turn-helix transcriptional regulator [Pseudomonas sp.]
MKSVIVDLQDERLARQWELGWSIDALSFRSGVSRVAITSLEAGTRTLRQVSMQALAFAFEQEGVVFLPNVAPMIGDNCRGSTTDPRDRPDYHLIE